MNSQPHTEYDEEIVDVRQVIAKLFGNWHWIAGSVLTFTLLAVAAAFLMRPVYRGSVVLISADLEREGLAGGLGSALGQLGGLASLAGLSVGGAGSQSEEALAVLRSRQFTESFIRERDLMPLLFESKWDAAAKRWRGEEKDWPTYGKAYKLFHEQIRAIEQDKKTGLVTLRIDWRDREQAADWANDLVHRLNVEMRTRAITKATASVGYLEKELDGTVVVATREAINRLIEAQVKQRMLANVTQEFAFRVVDKALPADADDPLRPKKLLLIAGGLLAGFGVGVTLVLMFAPSLPQSRRSRPA